MVSPARTRTDWLTVERATNWTTPPPPRKTLCLLRLHLLYIRSLYLILPFHLVIHCKKNQFWTSLTKDIITFRGVGDVSWSDRIFQEREKLYQQDDLRKIIVIDWEDFPCPFNTIWRSLIINGCSLNEEIMIMFAKQHRKIFTSAWQHCVKQEWGTKWEEISSPDTSVIERSKLWSLERSQELTQTSSVLLRGDQQ